MKPHLPLALSLLLVSCASRQAVDPSESIIIEETIHDLEIGPWENEYSGDNRIVGIWIQQFPDNPIDPPKYEGKHPCMVYYIFPDGRSHGFHYQPDGTVESDDWSDASDWMLEQLEIVYQPEVLKDLIRRAKKENAEQ